MQPPRVKGPSVGSAPPLAAVPGIHVRSHLFPNGNGKFYSLSRAAFCRASGAAPAWSKHPHTLHHGKGEGLIRALPTAPVLLPSVLAPRSRFMLSVCQILCYLQLSRLQEGETFFSEHDVWSCCMELRVMFRARLWVRHREGPGDGCTTCGTS